MSRIFIWPEKTIEKLNRRNGSLDHEAITVRNIFKDIGRKMQRDVNFILLQGTNIKEIALVAGYDNSNTVKAQKSRCLKTLKRYDQ